MTPAQLARAAAGGGAAPRGPPAAAPRPGRGRRAAAAARARAAAPAAAAAPPPPPPPPPGPDGTAPTRRLSAADAAAALRARPPAGGRLHAFYSSEFGGVVTDPAAMVVAADDHMVHRGHAVYGAARLVGGHVYQLDAHLGRLAAGAAAAGLPLPRGGAAQLRRAVLETAAASRRRDGGVRFWLSAGRGGFGLSPAECGAPAFYVAVTSAPPPPAPPPGAGAAPAAAAPGADHLRGWRVKTSPVPPKAPFFARLKSTGCLPSALCLADAQAEGLDAGIFVDAASGHALEGPSSSLGVLLRGGTLVVPPAGAAALPGVTMARLLELLPDAVAAHGLEGVARVERRAVTVDEAKAADEVFLAATSLPVMPVVEWDGQPIADGAPGPVALALRAMMEADAAPRPGSALHAEVPYGWLTAMGA